MQLPLIVGPDTAILRTVCQRVETFDDTLKTLVHNLHDTMTNKNEHGQIGIGIAAPQVGINARVCLVTLNASDSDAVVLVLVNPEIVQESNHTCILEEGCLSLPHEFGKVERASRITVRWSDIDGNEHERKFKGWDCRVIQHEIDHLDGKLFIDYL